MADNNVDAQMDLIQRSPEREREIAGVASPPLFGRGNIGRSQDATPPQAAPVRFKEMLTQPLTTQVLADNPNIEQSYYNRFIKFDDPTREATNAKLLLQSPGYLIPNRADEAIKSQGYVGQVPTIARSQSEEDRAATNFSFATFDPRLSLEQRGALMASQGAYSYAVAPDNASVDPDNPFAHYNYVVPRYVEDIRKANTPAEGYSALTSSILAKDTPGRGYETLFPILNKLTSNPADQAALISAENIKEMRTARAFQGARDTIGFVLDLAQLYRALPGFTEDVGEVTSTYETALESGVFLQGKPQYEIANAISSTVKSDAKVQDQMKEKGMLVFNPDSGTYSMASQYVFDYAGALKAEGFNEDAAESYWMYSRDAVERGYRFLGEEIPLAIASAGFRLGLSVVQTRRFNNWINTTYGSAEEAFKGGLTGGELAIKYLHTFPDRKLSGWAQSMAANSMRINLSVFKDAPNFSSANQIKVQAEELANTQRRFDDLLRRRDLMDDNDRVGLRNITQEIEAERLTINKLAKNIETAQAEVFKGTWLGDTLRTTGYGIIGASVAGQLVSDHFGGGEGSQAIAEVLGFMAGHTSVNLAIGGTKKTLQRGAYYFDKTLNLATSPFFIFLKPELLNPDVLKNLGAYDDLTFGLTKSQRAVLNSMRNLKPEALNSVKETAAYVRNLQTKLGSLINEKTGEPFFTEDYLEQTLGVVTGLNTLLLAEKQLASGIDLSEFRELGEEFYAREVIIGRKAELANRLNGAVAQLMSVATSETDADIRNLADGLASYSQQIRREITDELGTLESELDDRFGTVKAALSGDPDSIRLVQPNWKPGDPLPDMSEFLIRDDEAYRRVLDTMGVPALEATEKVNARMQKRLEEIKKSAEVYARDYGRAQHGGADNLGTYQYYVTRSINYNRATEGYNALHDKYGDTTLMNVTSFYDEVKADPALVETFNVPASSIGAQREAGVRAMPAHFRNWSAQFDTAAERTLRQIDDEIARAAENAGIDPETVRSQLYESLGLSDTSRGIEKWERVRAALRGDTSVEGITESNINYVRELLLPDLGEGLEGEDLQRAIDFAGRELAKDLPLAINLREFHMFKRGLNASIRRDYAKTTTGAGSVQERGMVDRLDELAESDDGGFVDNFFTEFRQPSNASRELAAQNKTFQVEFAQRHMRPPTPGYRIGLGVSPTTIPDLSRAGTTGNVAPDEFFVTILRPFATPDPLSLGLRGESTIINVNNEIAQVAGRYFDGPITVESMRNRTPGTGAQQTRGDTRGHYQLVAGDDSTEAFRGSLQLKLIEIIRNSPAAEPLRRALVKNGALTAGQLRKAEQELAGRLQRGEPILDDEKINMNFLTAVSELTMLKPNTKGGWTEVPLIDMDMVFKEVSIDTMFAADEQIKGLVNASINEHQNIIRQMIRNAQNDARLKTDINEKLSRSIQSLDADPQAFFFKQFNAGDVGFTEVEQVEQGLRAQLMRQVNLDLEEGRIASLDEGVAQVDEAIDSYRELRKEYFATWIRSQSEKDIDGVSVGLNFNTGEKGMTKKRGFDGASLLEAIGAGNDAMSQKRREIFMKMTGNDQELFDILQNIGDWAVINSAKFAGGTSIDGIPTGLSIESWISRIYSINRQVVSPRYVGVEALVQSYRMQGLSLVQAMVNDKKLAKMVQEILVSGKPLATEEKNFEMVQALTSAAGLIAIRVDRANLADEKAQEEEDVQIILPTMEEQMQQINEFNTTNPV